MAQTTVAIGAATVPYFGETANGDAWLALALGTTQRVALVDGVGHGEYAAAAAERALETIRSTSGLPLDDVMRKCHERLRDTRGAVVALADVNAAQSRLTFCGVGNIEARLHQAEREHRLVSHRGLLGAAMPTVRTFQFALTEPWLLIMHTDGVSGRHALDSSHLELLGEDGPEALARRLLASWGRTYDDATVVVVSSPRAESINEERPAS